MKTVMFAVVVVLVAVFSASCATATFSGPAMSAMYYVNLGKNAPAGLQMEIEEYISMADYYWNPYNERSDVYALNNADGEEGNIAFPRTRELIDEALAFYATGNSGGFYPHIRPLVELWNINALAADWEPPSQDDIDMARNKTGIELGAVGKGAACDDVLEIIKNAGLSNALVDMGGTVGCLGVKKENTKWKVGLHRPERGKSGMFGTLELADACVSTSGQYQRYKEHEGAFYGHILDPETGWPVDNGLLSVSVVGPSATVCDMLSTGLFVAGLEEGMRQLTDSWPEYEGVFVDDERRVYLTDGLKDIFTLNHETYEIA
ncbi:MAG: FAD:protein FMN transferase [Clostridia bacterium]|nr:FAD:protein FMN transferase [Clostridia bacterium]